MDADVTERVNLIKENSEVFQDLKETLVTYIKRGRSTPGRPQRNSGADPEYWDEIAWIRNV